MQQPESVLVTGVSGDLGTRLVPMLRAAGYAVIGVDLKTPPAQLDLREFHQLDLGVEKSCDDLIALLRRVQPSTVVHLAFVLDPRKTGVLDRSRMYQINVAGTARVIEAISEANRDDAVVRQVIHMSSVAAYGPELPPYVSESQSLMGRGLLYAVHKREADLAVQRRAGSFTSRCSTVILRPQIFSGPDVHNYMIDALRGLPSSNGRLGRRFKARGQKVPIVAGLGRRSLERKFQFVHVDDVARTICHLVRHPAKVGTLEVFNVAGSGEALTVQRCSQITGVRIVRSPSRWLTGWMLKLGWTLGISDMPPDALPYVLGEYTLSTAALQARLGQSYGATIRFSNEEALRAALAKAEDSDFHATEETRDAKGVGRP